MDKGESLPVFAQPVQSIPGTKPSSYVLNDEYSDGIGGLRLISSADSIGYYGETIGFWPIGWQNGFLEEVKVWTR